MKGVIFAELLMMAGSALSPRIIGEVISEAKLPSRGAYTWLNRSEPILDDMLLEHRSSRGLAHLAADLIDGSVEHFIGSLSFTSQEVSAGHNSHALVTRHRS